MDEAERRYRSGVARWAARDLDVAVEHLEASLEADPDPSAAWWFPATRALAQIAMERDDLERAAWHLRRLPGHGIGLAQQQALRARRALFAGDDGAAATEVSGGLQALRADPGGDDVATLMNGAIALIWSADVLVELGFGEEATRLITEARARVQAGRPDDAMVAAMLTLAAAGAARLCGRPADAVEALDQLDLDLDTEISIQATRLRARLTWDAGDHAAAGTIYQEAIAACDSTGFACLRRRLVEERQVGPPAPRSDPDPIERWAARALEAAIAAHVPYAVVVTLTVDDEPARFLALEGQVEALLASDASLGVIDGTGGNGENWELFVDGDDPVALWSAIRPLVEAIAPAPGSHAKVRRGADAVTIPLG